MYEPRHELTEDKWEAILNNDTSRDGTFFYAVATTGIFCRPSCKSRPPLKEHVRIFDHAFEAMEAAFRPCKRCKPDGLRLPDEEWMIQIIQWIDHHFAESITLQRLADQTHSSPYHLQRTFKRIKGITPAEYIQEKRMDYAMHELLTTHDPILDIAVRSGIPNAAHFATTFQKRTGLSPSAYRKKHIMDKGEDDEIETK
ncbi:AraC family transcriptional regulator [Paenibacillus selenitireducens]|uniref:AraC family transcriptional regulator n=1 Tax=Paenibacillus selenitireducens TaxID=1324314 RepID=A0A1T2X4J2_9BACL|nr:bifunctional transcriptional activator/DNA repair enzyme AdaA [Paenibacillus selenitireducens]OPA74789.1 AraC family transcriptional regulator [Paenibacillus selenitireducens]